MRVFLDANILFSASATASATRLILNRLVKHIQVVSNSHAWEEARRNLALKRPSQLSEFAKLEPYLELTSKWISVENILLPAEDQPILGGAVASHCSHLWTGDRRHFGPLYGKVIHGTRIVSSIQLADELESKGWL